MKKIILLLIFLSSFLFADCSGKTAQAYKEAFTNACDNADGMVNGDAGIDPDTCALMSNMTCQDMDGNDIDIGDFDDEGHQTRAPGDDSGSGDSGSGDSGSGDSGSSGDDHSPGGGGDNNNSNCTHYPFPSSYSDYNFINVFAEFGDAQSYADSHHILNFKLLKPRAFGVTSSLYCPDVALYGQTKCSVDDLPISLQGYRLQYSFNTFDDCSNYILENAKNQTGLCKQFDGCPLVYGYFTPKDNNNSALADDNNSVTVSHINDVNNFHQSTDYTNTNNDNGYNVINVADNSNDNVDFTPVLQSLSQMSLANHKDIKNIADKQDVTNTQLSSLNSNLNNFKNSNHADLSKVNQNLKDIKSKLYDDTLPNQSIDGNVSTADGIFSSLDINSSFLTVFGDNFSTAYDNLKGDLGEINSSATSILTLINGDKENFTLNLPHASVTECPYTQKFTFNGQDHDIQIDLCKPFSALYPVMYPLFRIVFLVFAVGFAIKSIIRLV